MKPHKHAELIKAWADGAEIQGRAKGNSEWRDLSNPTWFDDHEYRIKLEPAPWYEDIPENGVLCWAGHTPNAISSKHAVAIIVGYDENLTGKFVARTDNTWAYAKPLTNDEIKSFLRPEE